MTTLRELLRDLPVEAPEGDVEVRGVSHDSRRIGPGDLFVAVPGERVDGRRFAAEARDRGAVAAVGRGEAPPELGIPWIRAEDPRSLLGPLAARVYGHPEEKLRLVGVTGTNGKSTVVALVGAILDAAGIPTGQLGTLGVRFGGRVEATERTTPEAPDLYRSLAAMVEEGAEAAVLEISSHALDLGRVDGLAFDVAVFTNLTHDHLDFHGDLESYFAAKRRLFERLRPDGTAVVVAGDPHGLRLARSLRKEDRRVLEIGPDGDLEATRVEAGLEGLEVEARTPDGPLRIRSPLRGDWNVSNLLAAVGAARALDVDEEAVLAGISCRQPLAGRMEPVDRGQDFPAFVDYAHTPVALEAALESLRSIVGPETRIAVVFGCGGDRDTAKRAPMGEIAGRLADLPIATSDNPRGEDPQKILGEIESGLEASGNESWRIVPDRSDAICRAVRVACRGAARGERWALLVAGKGHETTQTIGDRVLPFSDRDELWKWLEEECHGVA